MTKEHRDPEGSALPGAERKEQRERREKEDKASDGRPCRTATAEVKQPAAACEEEGEAVRAPGNVIDRRAMDRMNHPEERGKEGCDRNEGTATVTDEALQQLGEQQVEQDPAADMPENIREMEAVGIGVPNQVIENVGDVLDRPIMGGEGIEKEIMPERLQDEDRAFDEGIVVGEVLVVPNELALERGEVDRESK